MRSITKTKKKGQLNLGDAPSIVLIVGLIFLVMATIAFIGEKYGDAMPSSNTASIVNETVLTVNSATKSFVAGIGACNWESFSVTRAQNVSNDTTTIPSTNYTVGSDGSLLYVESTAALDITGYNDTNWNITYTYAYAGAGCNVTNDLQTEISTNTSIAGIILTISLVGIVLSILIGVFVGVRRGGNRI